MCVFLSSPAQGHRSRPPGSSAQAEPLAGLRPLHEGPEAPRAPVQLVAQTAAASAQDTAWAARTLRRNPWAAAAGDPNSEPELAPHTHLGAPSRVPGAEARPTLTAAAVAAAEGWSSLTPSPTARGLPAKPPL